MKLFYTLVVLLSFVSIALAQDTIYVPSEQASIQAAIEIANNGDLVLVEDGHYYENINFKGKAITVASRFFTDGDESHIANTIIDGSESTSTDTASVAVFLNGEDTTSVLCGFTLTGGMGTRDSEFPNWNREGGGIYTSGSGAKIINNRIIGNAVVQTIPGNYNVCGGGICASPALTGKNLIIKNNVISDNYVEGEYYSFGAGIAVWPDGLTLIANNIITNNLQDASICEGGGIYITFAAGIQPQIINNHIIENTANSQSSSTLGGGGGLYVDQSPALLKNNLIVSNMGTEGAGIKIYNSLATIVENNTIVNNTASALGGGIQNVNSATQIVNSIIWGNEGSGTSNQISGTNHTVSYSDVEGGYTGSGNTNEDPQFVPGNNFFILASSSSCIDAGHSDLIYNDVEDPDNTGYPWWPAQGTLRNDMGHCGGPNSYWSNVIVNSINDDGSDILTPSEYKLYQNYPNPCNPSTKISWQSPVGSQQTLKIYDILGNEVATLVDEYKPAGKYEVEFSAASLPSGVYFYQLKAGEYINTKKMILLK